MSQTMKVHFLSKSNEWATIFSAGGIDFLGELQEARPCGVTYAVTASLSRSTAFAGT